MSDVVKDMIFLVSASFDEIFLGSVSRCDLFIALSVGIEGFCVFVGFCVVNFFIEVLMVIGD